MLYVTTRSNLDAYTVHRCLRENRGPDGGMYLPFRHLRFSESEMDELLEKPFAHCAAEVLNRLFHTRLSGGDVELAMGTDAVQLEPAGHHILLADCWHNPDFRFSRTLPALAEMLMEGSQAPSDWVKIAVRSAVLFGIFSELRRMGIKTADVSCVSGDFTTPISAWYARRWGLPIAEIVCCCNENNSVWELLSHGQMRTDAVSVSTILPEADVSVPVNLERLIYECGGVPETTRYLEALRTGHSYCPAESVLSRLRAGVYASVVSSHRLKTVIPSVYQSHGTLLSTYTALAYSGLLDFRAKTGSTNYAVVWSEEGPQVQTAVLSSLLEIPEARIKTLYEI